MQSKKDKKNGIVEAYIHSNKRIGVMLELFCESDFASRTQEFQELAHDLAMQTAAMGKKNFFKQKYIKNLDMTIENLIKEKTEKLGEEIKIGRILRYAF